MNENNAPQKNWLQQVQEWPATTKAYLTEVQMEMKRVTWPSRKQVEATTAVVILTVFAFAAYFWIVDQVLVRAIGGVQRVFTK